MMKKWNRVSNEGTNPRQLGATVQLVLWSNIPRNLVLAQMAIPRKPPPPLSTIS